VLIPVLHADGSQFIPQILNEHKRQGEEDRAFEQRVEGKKAAAKRKATRRCKCLRYWLQSCVLTSTQLPAKRLNLSLNPSQSQFLRDGPKTMTMTICMSRVIAFSVIGVWPCSVVTYIRNFRRVKH